MLLFDVITIQISFRGIDSIVMTCFLSSGPIRARHSGAVGAEFQVIVKLNLRFISASQNDQILTIHLDIDEAFFIRLTVRRS